MLKKMESWRISAGDVVMLPRRARFVRVESVNVLDNGSIRVSYSNLHTGAGIRSRTLAINSQVTLHPQFGKVIPIHG